MTPNYVLRADARYIRSSGAGRNALDFHIVYYLGQLAAAEPEAFFHVISADKGMDPLIEHMKAKGLNVYRHADVKHIPIVKLAPTAPDDEKLSCILAYLTARGSQRPASIKTLTGSSRALFSPKLTEDATARLLRLLEAEGIFTRNGNRIVYSLPV